jgi:hypothetical protein
VQSWPSLLQALATLCHNTCRTKEDPAGPSFVLETEPNALQRRAFALRECVQYDDTTH